MNALLIPDPGPASDIGLVPDDVPASDTARPTGRRSAIRLGPSAAAPTLLGPMPELDHAAHRARLGACPLLTRDVLIEELTEARLTGRGGGAFPVARKVEAMPRRGGDVVVNACEGDPTAAKDATLLARSPHLVIDGALILARALRARRTVIAVHEDAPASALQEALAQRPDASQIEIATVPSRYIASESSALLSHLHGGPALPTDPSVRGTDRARGHRATLVQNAETVAHVAIVARVGGAAFARASRGDETGTALVTVSGESFPTLVVEARDTDLVTDLLRACGARPAPDALVLTGGFTGSWVRYGDLAGVEWGPTSLARVGASRGVGSFVVLPAGACVLHETLELVQAADRVAAHQCGPCRFGLPSLADDLARITAGDGAALPRLERRIDLIEGRGGCSHPSATVGLVRSALALLDAPHVACAPHVGGAARAECAARAPFTAALTRRIR